MSYRKQRLRNKWRKISENCKTVGCKLVRLLGRARGRYGVDLREDHVRGDAAETEEAQDRLRPAMPGDARGQAVAERGGRRRRWRRVGERVRVHQERRQGRVPESEGSGDAQPERLPLRAACVRDAYRAVVAD